MAQEMFIKHLEFIQNIINRMSNNSFLLKGWSVTISTVVLALIIDAPKPLFVIVALFSSLAFWGLDAYYLRQERLFRLLYDDLQKSVISKKSSKVELFSLSTNKYNSRVSGWFRTLWSRSIVGLHGSILIAIIGTLVIMIVYT